MARPAEQAEPSSGVGVLARAALLVAGLSAAALLLHGLGRDALRGLHPDAWGAATYVVTATVLLAVGMPRWVAALGGGVVFGAAGGIALSFVAQMAACAADFFWARGVAREWTERRLKGRAARMAGFVRANPFTATLTLRLLPVGNSLALTLLGGASGVSPPAFLLASAIGFVPQTCIFALLGSGAHIGRETQLAVACVLFAVSGGLGVWLMRRTRAI